MTATATPLDVGERVTRLSTASVRRVLEPEELFDWRSLGAGQVIGDDLLTVRGLDLDLDAATRARLSREEVAAMLQMGIRFEAILNSGFSLQIAESDLVTDPRVTYMLHEIARGDPPPARVHPPRRGARAAGAQPDRRDDDRARRALRDRDGSCACPRC